MIESVTCHSERSEESQSHTESSYIAKARCFAEFILEHSEGLSMTA